MKSAAASKLARLMRERTAGAVSGAVGISQPTLRSHRDGTTTPTRKVREGYKRIGIEPAEWDAPAAGGAPSKPSRPRSRRSTPAGAIVDDLDGTLDAAQRLYRGGAEPPDILRGVNAALATLAAMTKTTRPRYVAEYRAFAVLANRLDRALKPFPRERGAVAGILAEHDGKAPKGTNDPAAPLVDIVTFLDGVIAKTEEWAQRDRAAAMQARVRAAKLLAKIDDDPATASDWPELRTSLVAALKANPKALAAAAAAFTETPA